MVGRVAWRWRLEVGGALGLRGVWARRRRCRGVRGCLNIADSDAEDLRFAERLAGLRVHEVHHRLDQRPRGEQCSRHGRHRRRAGRCRSSRGVGRWSRTGWTWAQMTPLSSQLASDRRSRTYHCQDQRRSEDVRGNPAYRGCRGNPLATALPTCHEVQRSWIRYSSPLQRWL